MLIHQIANKHLGRTVYCKGGGGSDAGAKAQAKATQKGIDLQREQWLTNMNNLAWATPLAEQYVKQLQGLSTLEGQNSALNDYYNSAQYQGLADQARQQTLRSAQATGGLGSTATGNQLAAIAPQLGQNWLSGQMNNYQNLANIGLGALTGQSTAGQTYANNASQLYQQQANTAAANDNRPSGLQSALGGAASGAAIGTAIMPGWGTAIGAGVGALGSLF
ncbi:DNA transfer protein [Leclercia adecarboxylata]|uniref:DNA transfer protein n=1 Tax=Leclercia adecarboxylata TaxID=83655 RepID=UPI003018DD01